MWLLRQKSAWIPIALSISIIAMFWGILVSHWGEPLVREKDEGAPAHIFQLWIFIEFFALLYFSAVWFPKMPRQTLQVLAIQIGVAMLAASPVFIMRL